MRTDRLVDLAGLLRAPVGASSERVAWPVKGRRRWCILPLTGCGGRPIVAGRGLELGDVCGDVHRGP